MTITLRPYYTQGFDGMAGLLERVLPYFPEGFFDVKPAETFDMTGFNQEGDFVKGYFSHKILAHAMGLAQTLDEKVLITTQHPIVTDFYTPEGQVVMNLITGSAGPGRDCQIGCGYPVALASSYGMVNDLCKLAKTTAHELGHDIGMDHCPLGRCIMHSLKTNIAILDKQILFRLTKKMDKIDGFCQHHSNVLKSMLD